MPLVFKYPGVNKSQGSEGSDEHIIRSVMGSSAVFSRAEEQDIENILFLIELALPGRGQVHLNCLGRRHKYD